MMLWNIHKLRFADVNLERRFQIDTSRKAFVVFMKGWDKILVFLAIYFLLDSFCRQDNSDFEFRNKIRAFLFVLIEISKRITRKKFPKNVNGEYISPESFDSIWLKAFQFLFCFIVQTSLSIMHFSSGTTLTQGMLTILLLNLSFLYFFQHSISSKLIFVSFFLMAAINILI